ncbi:ABC transporter permease [Actinomadura sp. NAK00032]|uniref:ABC transporter permease n=1 Tax=Actinomadura sp. NAK00032 TaxID=2742128 RepID=UPI0020C7D4E1|nr:ABC transporter permease [Actinomadura sp. NAK00032]
MTTMTVDSRPRAAAEPPARVSPRRTLRHGLTLAWRNLAQLRHSPEKLLDTTLMPIVFLVLFLYVFGGAVAGGTHAYLQELLPGLVAMMTMFATMGVGTALNEDIHKGVFDRFRSLPIARSAPLIGTVLGDTARFVTVMTMLVGFGSVLGFRFHTDPLSVVAAFALAYVFYLAVCWFSVLVGLIAPSPDTVQGLSFLWVMPLTFGSNILVPNTATMPGWLQAWTDINPVTHLAASVRALTVGGPVGNHVWYTLAWAAGITLATFPLAMRMYSRRA